MQVLVVDPAEHTLPQGASALLNDIRWHVIRVADYPAAIERAKTGEVDAAILCPPHETHRPAFEELLRLLAAKRIAAVMVGDDAGSAARLGGDLLDVVHSAVSPDELRGRLTMIERYHPLLRRLEAEMHTMERLSRRLGDHFKEVDQELRLAARLQRDFLPDLRQPFGHVRMSALFRPASWVSGDLYDVFRIDDEHTGMYIIDAVGHGMAASLLTMFIKRAIVPTRTESGARRILDPSEVLTVLNDALTDQALPHSQFVTACYALIHHPTMTFRYARGGHPYPIHISTTGELREIETCGGLLGITKGEEFPSFETRLQPGEKVLFYTDGLELAFPGTKEPSLPPYERAFADTARLPLDEMVTRIGSRLDGATDPNLPRDDVTLLGLEIDGRS